VSSKNAFLLRVSAVQGHPRSMI